MGHLMVRTSIFSTTGISAQDKRGHLKAPKFGQCCCKSSEFYSSFSQFGVCRHRDYRGLYFAAWIDLLFNENESFLYSWQQTTAVNYSFVFLCCQMSVLHTSQEKMFSNKKSETAVFCASDDIFLKLLWNCCKTDKIR